MRVRPLLSALLLFVAPAAEAYTEVTVTSPERETLLIEMTFGEADLSRRADGSTTVSLEGCHPLSDPARPALPVQTIRVALPDGLQAIKAGLSAATYAPTLSRCRIRPLSPPCRVGTAPALVHPFSRADPVTEVQPVALLGQADLAGQSFAVLSICPARYDESTGELRMATAMLIELVCSEGYLCGDYLPACASKRARGLYERMLGGMVVNPDNIELRHDPAGPPSPRGVGPGQYDYVIITSWSWAGQFEELARWRTRSGIPTKVVTTAWIYVDGGYEGSDLKKVREFMKDAHENWGTTCFLLGGDASTILYHTANIEIPEMGYVAVPNDTYYADLDNDFVLEVTVARASLLTYLDVPVFIEKTLSYEKNPPLTDYATKAAFFGFDITDPWDRHGEICKERIRELYVPPEWTLNTEYDSEYGYHKNDVLAYLNEGHHIVNHFDHCNVYVMGTGWICHESLMETEDIAGLTNGDRQSIAFSIGCLPARFSVGTSIAEEFVRNPSGGGLAFVGNTSYGWSGPLEDPDHYAVRQDRLFFKNLFDDGFIYLGENFTDLKNDAYDPVDPYNLNRHAFKQLHLLGPPMVPVWTADPRTMTVVHPDSIASGTPAQLPVLISDRDSPLDGATVCLWKGDEVYLVDETSGGQSVLEFTAGTPGTLLVTATCHNYLAYEGQVIVGPPGVNAVVLPGEMPSRPLLRLATPNPFRTRTELAFTVPVGSANQTTRLAIYNCSGQLVRTLVDDRRRPGPYAVIWDGKDERGTPAASGVYCCELLCGGERVTAKLALLR